MARSPTIPSTPRAVAQKRTEERWIEFRIGVNVGDIIFENGDIYGDGVNVAARVKTSPSLAASRCPPWCETKSVIGSRVQLWHFSVTAPPRLDGRF